MPGSCIACDVCVDCHRRSALVLATAKRAGPLFSLAEAGAIVRIHLVAHRQRHRRGRWNFVFAMFRKKSRAMVMIPLGIRTYLALVTRQATVTMHIHDGDD